MAGSVADQLLRFEVYAKDDLNGSPVGELTPYISEKQFEVELGDTGGGSFKVNRNMSVGTMTALSNYVRVYITDQPDDDGNYPSLSGLTPIGGFFLEGGSSVLLTPEERGGEIRERSGNGPLAYMTRAIIWHEATADVTATVDGTRRGVWQWDDSTIGQALLDLIADAQARGAIDLVTVDFDETNDSDGNPWDTIDGPLVLPVGMDLLAVIKKLGPLGLTCAMSHDFVLSGYQDFVGADKTGTVTLAEAVNVADRADLAQFSQQSKSQMLVRGSLESGLLKWTDVHSGTQETALGGRREGFIEYAGVARTTPMQKAGQSALTELGKKQDGPAQLRVIPGDGTQSAEGFYLPFTDYEVGDTVTLDIPAFDAVEKTVYGLTLVEIDGGGYDVIVQFDAPPLEQLGGETTTNVNPDENDSGSGGSPCNDCPPDVPFVPGAPSEAIITNSDCVFHTTGLGDETYVHAGFPSGSEPDAGDVVVFCAAVREGSSITLAPGWTLIGSATQAVSGGELAFRTIMAAIVADPGAASAAQPTAGNFRLSTSISNVSYRAGCVALKGVTLEGIVGNVYNAANTTARAMSVNATGKGTVVTAYGIDWVNDLTDGAGFTTFCTGLGSNGNNIAPRGTFATQNVSGAGTYTNTVAIGQGGQYGGGVIAFFPGAPQGTPYGGQWVTDDAKTSGDGWSYGTGATTDVTVDQTTGYVTGSLRVKVQGRNISSSAVVEDDPAAGTFHLTWRIAPYETVTVEYQKGFDPP